ncbi:hypothetical protein ES703_36595 [subsurface metagenome]
MKTKVIITFLVILILCGVNSVQADVVWTEGYHQYGNEDFHEHVSIYNDVRLDIDGGVIGYLDTFNTTLTNWFDGNINYLRVHDSSIINISGGELSIVLSSDGNGSINLYQSSLIKAVSLGDNAVLNLYAKEVIHSITGGHYDDGWIEGKYISNNQYFHIDMIQDSFSHINIIPEPSTLLLLGLGSLLFIRKR